MSHKQHTFKNFLTFEDWEDAINLLHIQVSAISKNKHFSTLSMYYYRNLGTSVSDLQTTDYFNKKVVNNLFYGLSQEFANIEYLTPKQGLGIRKYRFINYPMRLLYYSVGIYILKLSSEWLINYPPSYIHSYYGGKLSLADAKLEMTDNNIWYYNQYKSFRKKVRKEAENPENKIVIRLDIQNFFDEISLPILLDHLYKYVHDDIKREKNYDPETINQIIDFISYLVDNNKGIPQADNDIISSFLAHLYMTFGDLFIDDLIKTKKELIENYKIIRYVDDIYVVIQFKNAISDDKRKSVIKSLSYSIADKLYQKLELRLNPKSRFFLLNRDEDLKDYLESLKKISHKYLVNIDSEKEPSTKVDEILSEILALKESYFGIDVNYKGTIKEEILREIFDKRVNQLLNSKQNQMRLKKIFLNFDFENVKVSPREIIIIIMKNSHVEQEFRSFLLKIENLSTKDVDVILHYLSQVEFKDKELLDKLSENDWMRPIIDIFKLAKLFPKTLGYYELSKTQIDTIISNKDHPYIIEQIQLRVLSENRGYYSVALNHLLNEIHAICAMIEATNTKIDIKNYKANNVIKFLQKQGLEHELCIQIKNLFARRNQNAVSHPSNQEQIAWGVSRSEYLSYRNSVADCLKFII